jgi:hypothetical protein
MPHNLDIAVLAKKVYELSVLPPAEIDRRKWEALLILNAVYSSATPEGITAANADKETRWGAQIHKEGLLAGMHPKWHLRTDDGKPPAARHALASALDNPHRDLRTRLAALQFIPPADRPPLEDVVRALVAEAFADAKGEAREQYLEVMRRRSPTWFREPWLTVLPDDSGLPPVLILIDNPGPTHDGGIYDNDADDTILDTLSWSNAIRTWDVDFLRDNPLAQFYTGVEAAARRVVGTAGEVADAADEAARGLATLLKWAPYALAIGAIGATAAFVVAMRRPPPSHTPPSPADT